MKILRDKDLAADTKSEFQKLITEDEADSSSVEHLRASRVETAQLNRAIHGSANTKAISLKMPSDLLEDLKRLAHRDHIGYQTYIKFVLAQHVRKMRDSKQETTE